MRRGGGFAVSQSTNKAAAFDFAPAASHRPESSARLRPLLFFHLAVVLKRENPLSLFPHKCRSALIERTATL